MTWSLIAVLLSAAPAAPSASGLRAVARTSGESVSAAELLARAEAGGVPPRDALEDLIGEMLLGAEGRKAGIAVPARAAPQIDQARRQAALALYLEKEVYPTAQVPEADLRERFHQRGDQVKLQMIVRATREEAQAALERLQKGGSFAEEAKASIDEGTRAKGGAVGWMPRSAIAAPLAAVVFTAEPKKPQGPVAVPGGFAVYQVDDRRLPDERAFELTRPALRRDLEPRARADALAALRVRIVQEQKGKVEELLLASTGDRIDADAKTSAKVVASAGKVTLTYAQLARELHQSLDRGGMGNGRATPQIKITLAFSMLAQELIERAALAKYGKAPEVVAAGRAVERAELARLYGDKLRAAAPAGTDTEIEGRYQAHRAEYTTPAGRRCWQLAGKTEDDAKKLAGRAAAGEDFAKVAKDSADRASGAQGGLVGIVSDAAVERLRAEGGEPELVAAFAGLPAGQLSKPIRLKAGWVVLRCDAHQPEQLTPLDKVRHRVSMELKAERGEAAVKARVEALRAKVKVDLEEALLAQIAPPPAATSAAH